MDTNSEILLILGFIILILLGSLGYFIYALNAREITVKELRDTLERLMRSFNELDEQAKLIVRTDLELNKTREEMNKRLNGLNALQRTSRQMTQALNENEVFQKISPTLLKELGFSFVFIACVNDANAIKTRLNLGFQEAQADTILKAFTVEEVLRQMTHSFSSNNASGKIREKITQIFGTEHFIISPILIQTGNIGFVLVGNRLNGPSVTQADEELITILAGQIGQSIENAHLFEKVFRSSQELEIKVSDRTKQLAGALQKVNEISKKKSEFISAVSHELRTPLTSIKGYAAILIAGKIGELPDAVKERLNKINTHSDNLVSLINDLLDIARIESGRQEMKCAPCKAKDLIENIVDLLTPQITAKNIKLVVNVPVGIETVYIDLPHAQRVLINLLSNAVKFTPGFGTITVGLAPALNHGFAVFSVSDTGIGIPPADVLKLFSEFFRVENEINQNVKGTGLGLVLAKNIVQAHRGKIWVESKVGLGTTFYFTLPATQQAFVEHEHLINPEKNYA